MASTEDQTPHPSSPRGTDFPHAIAPQDWAPGRNALDAMDSYGITLARTLEAVPSSEIGFWTKLKVLRTTLLLSAEAV